MQRHSLQRIDENRPQAQILVPTYRSYQGSSLANNSRLVIEIIRRREFNFTVNREPFIFIEQAEKLVEAYGNDGRSASRPSSNMIP